MFDAHIHMWDDTAAAKVAAVMQGQGAGKYAILSLSGHRDDPLQNLTVLLAKALAPETCYAFCGPVHAHAGETVLPYEAQLKLWMDAGFDGIKFIETKPNTAKATGVRLDSEAFEATFAACEAQGIPVLWHVGDPAPFWDPELCPPVAKERGWAYLDGTFYTLDELYAMTERVLDRHPNLRVTLAHFYFTSDAPEHAARMMEAYPNLQFDLTPGTEMYEGFTQSADFFRPFFLKYADRIQFGTDTEITDAGTPRTELIDAVRRFLTTGDEFTWRGMALKGFALPKDVTDRLFAGTAKAFFGRLPKPLCRDAALAAADATLDLLARRGDPRLELGQRLRGEIAERIPR